MAENGTLTLRNLTKAFVNEAGQRVPVLSGLDLVVKRGEFVWPCWGPRGGGKTTLLRILLGLEAPSGGEVLVGGTTPREGRVAAGAVFQQNSLFPWKRVLNNVTFPLELRGVSPAAARKKAMELLKLVRLEHAARSFPYELSGGMQQRASIARALAKDAGVLLMDEPFGALDDRTRHVLQEALLDIWRDRGLTILFVTHNIEEALVMGTRVVVMGRGAVLRDEAVDMPRPRDPLSPEFAERFLALRTAFAEAVEK